MPRAKPHEIDLHGLNIEQALARFTLAYDEHAIAGGGTRLIVIHGWNASDFKHSIAAALHRLLNRRGIEFEYPFEGNRGRTSVRIAPQAKPHSTKARHPKHADRPPKTLRGGI